MESKWRRWSRWRWLRGSIPVPAGCQNRNFWPPKRGLAMAAALRKSFWSIRCIFRVFASGWLNRRRGNVGGVPSGPNHLLAPPPFWPRLEVVWRPWASPWLALLAPCVPRKNRRFGFCFVEFREYCPNSFSGTKNSRKQELALWHLVNRLIPENA